MRISRSDKIDPPGYCVAISHDQEDFDFVNHAYKTDIMKVILNFGKKCICRKHFQQLKEVGGNPRQHAALLKEGCEDDTAVVGKNTSSRSCLLIPVTCLNDDLIIKCCDGNNLLQVSLVCFI